MFVKPPEGLKDRFGFVYDHESYYLTEADNKWEEWHGSSSSFRYNGAIVISKKIKLLDLGCGFGFFIHHAKNEGIDASGIDSSKFDLSKKYS